MVRTSAKANGPELPIVSAIIPVRNEEKHIEQCLNSILQNDYPHDRLEILVVDGMSEDRTRELVEKYCKQYGFVRLIDNPKRSTPYAFNIGIQNTRGEIILTVGAHTTYSSNYISTIAEYITAGKADCVGSVAETMPRKDTIIGHAICKVLSSTFGAGNSHMRTGAKEPRYADTASCPGYKKSIFKKIGLFDENFVRNQDLEFNIRLRRDGYKILLVPDIVSYYYARSKLVPFFMHNFRDGVSVIYPYPAFRLRHLVPLAFIVSLISSAALSLLFPIFLWLLGVILGSYVLANVYCAVRITLRERDVRYLFAMPIVFVARHIGYGLGSVWGLLKGSVSKQFWRNCLRLAMFRQKPRM